MIEWVFKAIGYYIGAILSLLDISVFLVLLVVKGRTIKSYDLRTPLSKKRVGQVITDDVKKGESAPYRHVDFVHRDLMECPENIGDGKLNLMSELFDHLVERFAEKTLFSYRTIKGQVTKQKKEVKKDEEVEDKDGKKEKKNAQNDQENKEQKKGEEGEDKKSEPKSFPIPSFGPVESLTYKQVGQQVDHLSNNLRNKLKIKQGECVAFYLETSPEWMTCAHACFKSNILVATLFSSLAQDVVSALSDVKPVALFVQANMMIGDKKKKLTQILSQVDKKTLKTLIVNTRQLLDSERKEYKDTLSHYGSEAFHFEIHDFDQLTSSSHQHSAASNQETNKAKSSDLAVIMFTSGTTGTPKGVQLTHRNLLSAIGALNYSVGLFRESIQDNIKYEYMAYLPLAHILELIAEHVVMLRGGKLNYGYNARTLNDSGAYPKGDLNTFKPTVMVGVPKVFDTIQKAAKEKMNKAHVLVRSVLETALWYKTQIALQYQLETPVWNYLLFDRMFKPLLGGRVNLIMCGGAALNKHSHEFMRACFDAPVIQGYGLTETSACCALLSPGDDPFSTERVGAMIPACEVKLVDQPDMGYTNNDKPNPRGLIKVRGNCVFKMYHGQPDKTKEVVDDEGWFDTGDIGQINAKEGNYTLSVVDRMKNLVKLSHGEYIAVEKIESKLSQSEFVRPNGLMVYANSDREYATALVLPQESYLKNWASSNGKSGKSIKELCQDPDVNQAVLKSLEENGKKAGLDRYEMVKKVTLLDTDWTSENGMLSSAEKLKRSAIEKENKDAIEKMYQ